MTGTNQLYELLRLAEEKRRREDTMMLLSPYRDRLITDRIAELLAYLELCKTGAIYDIGAAPDEHINRVRDTARSWMMSDPVFVASVACIAETISDWIRLAIEIEADRLNRCRSRLAEAKRLDALWAERNDYV